VENHAAALIERDKILVYHSVVDGLRRFAQAMARCDCEHENAALIGASRVALLIPLPTASNAVGSLKVCSGALLQLWTQMWQ
jgi:hypothetical protein